MIDYSKMSLRELQEVARVQAHELQTLRTTKFKDEFARQLGLKEMSKLRKLPFNEWSSEQYEIYADVSVLNRVGARCWREGDEA